MDKVTQQNRPFAERRKACLDAGFYTHRKLHKAVQIYLSEPVAYSTITNALYGYRLSGQTAQKVMKAISAVLNQPVSILWPELN